MRDFIRFIFMSCLMMGVGKERGGVGLRNHHDRTGWCLGFRSEHQHFHPAQRRAGEFQGTPDATELTADTGTINHTTDDMTATGNVILRRDGTVWKAERLDYNFKTKAVSSVQFRTGSLGYFMRGQAMDGNQTKGVYQAKGIQFTTDDVDTPAMFIRAKEVEVAPGDYIIFRNATLYIGKCR